MTRSVAGSVVNPCLGAFCEETTLCSVVMGPTAHYVSAQNGKTFMDDITQTLPQSSAPAAGQIQIQF